VPLSAVFRNKQTLGQRCLVPMLSSLVVGLCAAGGTLAATSCLAQAAAPASPAAQTNQYPELPNGPGKDTLIQVCGQCHSPDNGLANGQSREGWEATITKMAGFGAQGSDQDFTAILDYLTKNFPTPTNVNKATAAELVSGLSLSQADADAIVAYREKNGNFKSVDDLKKVPGVDTKKLDAEKTWLAF
jgi:competence protein ComEA